MPRPANTTPRSSTRPSRVPLVTVSVIAASLLLAACGGSSPSSTSPAATAADNALKFSKCMREHGVKNFPDPETVAGGGSRLQFKAGGPESVSPQTLEAAQSACKRYSPPEQQKITPAQKVEHEEAALKFAKCMREHGIDVHISTLGGSINFGIHASPKGGGPNPESSTFQTAQKDCQGLLPGLKGGAPGAPVRAGGSERSSAKGGGSEAGLSLSAGG